MELSLCRKLRFLSIFLYNPMLGILDIDQGMYFVRSNNLSLKYQRCTPSRVNYIEIRKIEILTRTRFLCQWNRIYMRQSKNQTIILV